MRFLLTAEEAAVPSDFSILTGVIGRQCSIILYDFFVGIGVFFNCLGPIAFKPWDSKNTTVNIFGNRQWFDVPLNLYVFIKVSNPRRPVVSIVVKSGCRCRGLLQPGVQVGNNRPFEYVRLLRLYRLFTTK